jgi:hypothetical protein
MPYDYNVEKHKLFNDEGQKLLFSFHERCMFLLDQAGAVRMDKLYGTGDAWTYHACADRLVELGKIVEVTDTPNPCSIPGQHRIFVRAD